MAVLPDHRRRRDRAAGPLLLVLPALCVLLPTCTRSVQAVAPQPPSSVAAVRSAAPEADDPGGDRIVLRQGDQPPGGDGMAVSRLGLAVTDQRGALGFTGQLTDGTLEEGFLWRDGEIVWRSSWERENVGTPGPLVGLGDVGEFVFRVLVDRVETLWSHNGLLLTKGQAAPGMEDPATIVFSRRPTMTSDGTAHWVSEFEDEAGRGRVLYRSPDADPAATSIVLRSDDLVDGLPIARPYGLDLAYQVSHDGEHLIQVVRLETGPNQIEEAVYVDGEIVLRAGNPASSADNWTRFVRVAINDDGHYLVAGETDAPTAKDTVLAVDGEVALREGESVGEVELASEASILGLSIDNEGRVAHLWSTGGFGRVYLLLACDSDRLDLSQPVVSTRELLELEAPTPPTTIQTFLHGGHGPPLRLGPGGAIHAEVNLLEKVEPIPPEPAAAILEMSLPPCAEE